MIKQKLICSKETTPVRCVLGLGSNKPFLDFSSVELINAASKKLQNVLADFSLSPLYKTAPMYVTDQEPFINAAASGLFSGSAHTLLEEIQKIETLYGRDRSVEQRWGTRTLDIDILLFGDYIIEEPDLVIPHPRLKERVFALRPLLDLVPDASEPGTGKQYAKIIEALPCSILALLC